MKLLQTISKKLRLGTTKAKLVAGITVATIAFSTAAVFAGWSPERPVLDWKNEDDRKGSLNGPRMNAFINTPYYGDERAFFDARRSDQTTGDVFKDVLHDPTKGSKEVVLRTYIHNGANQSTNESGKGMAKDAKVRIDLPTGTSNALRARSYISISNPAPGYPAVVTDTTELVDGNQFSIKYIPGSARLYNDKNKAGVKLSDEIVSDKTSGGALIGHDKMNGEVPGCFEFQAFVEIRVKVVVPEEQITKQVRKAGTTEYKEFAQVNTGEKVEWLVKYQNTGDLKVDDVKVYDHLPPHLKVVPGSVRWIYRDVNGKDQDVKQSDVDLFSKYVNFGTWNPNGGFFLRFDTTAKDDFKDCEVTVRNIVYQQSKQHPNDRRDHADVKIVKKDCKPEKPVYSCNLLTAKSVANKERTYQFTTATTARGGATVKQYRYEFTGVGYKQTATTNQANGFVEHQFPREGDYTAKVTVDFNVDGQTKSHTAEACMTTIKIEKPVTPEQPKPEVLPETGLGSIAGIFTATSAAGALAHRMVWAARRNRF